MATATQIATRALKRLGIIDSRSTADAHDVADATEELTGMINGFEAHGLSGDVLPLDARFENAITDMLVVRIAPMFGREPTPYQMKLSNDGWSSIQAAFFAVPTSTFDSAIEFTGPWSDIAYIIGDPVEDIEDWQASTAYTVRKRVVNNKNVYECVTSGTSASSGGPTGTDAEITDGTVTWVWRAVTG